MIKVIAFDLVGVLVKEKEIELTEEEAKFERLALNNKYWRGKEIPYTWLVVYNTFWKLLYFSNFFVFIHMIILKFKVWIMAFFPSYPQGRAEKWKCIAYISLSITAISSIYGV